MDQTQFDKFKLAFTCDLVDKSFVLHLSAMFQTELFCPN